MNLVDLPSLVRPVRVMRLPPYTPHSRRAETADGCRTKTALLSLLSGSIFRPDNSVPPRISLGLAMAHRRPVASGDSVEVPYDFACMSDGSNQPSTPSRRARHFPDP